jgi:hypothetical protein
MAALSAGARLNQGGAMKGLAGFALFLFTVPALAGAQTKPNFTGTWVLDVAKSSASAGEPLEPETLVVAQTDTELKFERSGEPGARVVRLDGKVSRMGGALIHANWKRDTLTMAADVGFAPEQLADRRFAVTLLAWSLSGDGKTLTVDGVATRRVTEPSGTTVTDQRNVKRVYRKR